MAGEDYSEEDDGGRRADVASLLQMLMSWAVATLTKKSCGIKDQILEVRFHLWCSRPII